MYVYFIPHVTFKRTEKGLFCPVKLLYSVNVPRRSSTWESKEVPSRKQRRTTIPRQQLCIILCEDPVDSCKKFKVGRKISLETRKEDRRVNGEYPETSESRVVSSQSSKVNS